MIGVSGQTEFFIIIRVERVIAEKKFVNLLKNVSKNYVYSKKLYIFASKLKINVKLWLVLIEFA